MEAPANLWQRSKAIAKMQYSLNTILYTVLLSTATFASPLFTLELPAPSNGTSISARDQNIGSLADIQIMFYSAPNCGEGAGSLWPKIVYNTQMYGISNSFTLSRDLIDKEVLDLSTGTKVPHQTFAMTEAQASSSGQYPGPGYVTGEFNVPSACDAFLWTLPAMAPSKNPNGSKKCYTAPRAFNCARFWMQS